MTVAGGPTWVIEDALKRECGMSQDDARHVAIRIQRDLNEADYRIVVERQPIPGSHTMSARRSSADRWVIDCSCGFSTGWFGTQEEALVASWAHAAAMRQRARARAGGNEPPDTRRVSVDPSGQAGDFGQYDPMPKPVYDSEDRRIG